MKANHTLSGSILALIFIISGLLFTYQNIELNTFHFDDFDNIVSHQPVRMESFSWSGLVNAWQNSFSSQRPFPGLTFALDWWRGEGQAKYFLQTNLLIHGLSSIIFFFLLLQIFSANSILSFRLLTILALVTLLWSVHPLQSQAVTYIVQRMAMMSALFSMLSILAYIRLRTTPDKFRCFVVFIVSAFAAVSSKENAYILPVLIILTEYGVCRHNKKLIRGYHDWVILSLPILIVLFLIIDLLNSEGIIRTAFPYNQRDFTLQERMLTQPRVIFFHFSQFFWPIPERFSVEHTFSLSRSFLNPASTLFSLIAVAVWLAIGIYLFLKEKQRLWGYFLLWIPITLSIESSFIPLELIFEHRMYLPLFGLAGLLILIINEIDRRFNNNHVVMIPVFLILLSFIILASLSTRQRLPDWQSKITLLESAIDNAPKSNRVWGGLSNFYYRNGQYDKSLQTAQKALQLNPKNLYALETMGVIHLDRKQLHLAEINLAYVLQHRPYDIVWNHWGELKLQQNKVNEAIDAFSRAIKLKPWIAVYHWNIALSYERKQYCQQARKHWIEFIKLSQENDPSGIHEVQQHLHEEYEQTGGKCFKKYQMVEP